MKNKPTQRTLTKKANELLKKAEVNDKLREKTISNTFWKHFKK